MVDIDRRFLQDGWLKCRWDGYVLFMFFNRWEYPGTHGHQDLGSFSLFYKGEPLFIDPGRYSYREEGYESFGARPEAHNLVTIDRLAAVPQRTARYVDEYHRSCGCRVRFPA